MMVSKDRSAKRYFSLLGAVTAFAFPCALTHANSPATEARYDKSRGVHRYYDTRSKVLDTSTNAATTAQRDSTGDSKQDIDKAPEAQDRKPRSPGDRVRAFVRSVGTCIRDNMRICAGVVVMAGVHILLKNSDHADSVSRSTGTKGALSNPEKQDQAAAIALEHARREEEERRKEAARQKERDDEAAVRRAFASTASDLALMTGGTGILYHTPSSLEGTGVATAEIPANIDVKELLRRQREQQDALRARLAAENEIHADRSRAHRKAVRERRNQVRLE